MITRRPSGTIVNHSSKASTYTIHVKFKDASGNDVGDGVSAVAKVDPNETAKWSATSSLNNKGSVKCSISSVTRNAVPDGVTRQRSRRQPSRTTSAARLSSRRPKYAGWRMRPESVHSAKRTSAT